MIKCIISCLLATFIANNPVNVTLFKEYKLDQLENHILMIRLDNTVSDDREKVLPFKLDGSIFDANFPNLDELSKDYNAIEFYGLEARCENKIALVYGNASRIISLNDFPSKNKNNYDMDDIADNISLVLHYNNLNKVTFEYDMIESPFCFFVFDEEDQINEKVL